MCKPRATITPGTVRVLRTPALGSRVLAAVARLGDCDGMSGNSSCARRDGATSSSYLPVTAPVWLQRRWQLSSIRKLAPARGAALSVGMQSAAGPRSHPGGRPVPAPTGLVVRPKLRRCNSSSSSHRPSRYVDASGPAASVARVDRRLEKHATRAHERSRELSGCRRQRRSSRIPTGAGRDQRAGIDANRAARLRLSAPSTRLLSVGTVELRCRACHVTTATQKANEITPRAALSTQPACARRMRRSSAASSKRD